jgi:hypothetical protein
MTSNVRVGLRNEFKTLRLAMQSLDSTLQKLVSVNGTAEVVSNGRSRRKVRLSPRARAALILQGRYMGYMRQLKPRQKAQVRRLKEAKGVRAAIARARQLSAK